MRIATFREGSGVRAGLVVGDGVRLSGPIGSTDLPAWLRAVDDLRSEPQRHPLVGLDGLVRAAPIPRPGKVVAIGLNYVDHATEGAFEVPRAPLIFAKYPTSVIGPGDAIRWRADLTSAVDFEAELAVCIGRTATRVSLETALEHVLGYCCLNDVSARDLQFADQQWVRGKSLDSFCPMGPEIVTADEIGDPQALGISCIVSGEVLQKASTADMIFSVAELVSYCSHHFTLEPGDVIATGTPPGVGWFREPRRVLRSGDVVEVRIEGIGSLVNPCVVDEASR